MSLIRYLQAFWNDVRGVAAVEYALTVPFMLILFLGGVEVTRYVLIHQKAERVAYTIGDLVAQSEEVSVEDLEDIYAAAGHIMGDYGFAENGVVIVSSVTQTAEDVPPVVSWQDSGGGALVRASRVGDELDDAELPDGLTLSLTDNVIVAEVFFRFTPLFVQWDRISGQDLYKQTIFRPRLGALSDAPT